MIRLNQVKMAPGASHNDFISKAAALLKIKDSDIKSLEIARRSIDARDKNDVRFVYSFDIETNRKVSLPKNAEEIEAYIEPTYPKKDFKKSPIIIGSGPAGLFAALTLAKAGADPIVLERGEDVDSRHRKIQKFWTDGTLDINSNVQFGEGGAGTFSDGKLNTGTKDIRQKQVLREFVKAGAPREILYNAKPHIGTDYLRIVVKNIRLEIERLGGKVLFNHKVTGLDIKNEKICGVFVADKYFETDHVILAIGHSARDTFKMLFDAGINMTQKAFSVGVRIEHDQQMINASQYGKFANHPALGAADYKLSTHLKNGRGVYSFCMCPGGLVVAAASEEGMVCTNGMSNFARCEKNANSALLVGITPEDFESDHPLLGIEFQRKLERLAFKMGGENYRAPSQRVGDFIKGVPTTQFGAVTPSYLPGVSPCDLNPLFPREISESLRDGILDFDRKIRGFANADAVLTGVEARSSSPVRIVRDENLQSLCGLYPCGEGAGYAGGIMSAAVDGIRVAERILL